MDLEDRPDAPTPAGLRGSIEEAIGSLRQLAKGVVAVVELEGVEHGEPASVGLNAEDPAELIEPTVGGGAVDGAIRGPEDASLDLGEGAVEVLQDSE